MFDELIGSRSCFFDKGCSGGRGGSPAISGGLWKPDPLFGWPKGRWLRVRCNQIASFPATYRTSSDSSFLWQQNYCWLIRLLIGILQHHGDIRWLVLMMLLAIINYRESSNNQGIKSQKLGSFKTACSLAPQNQGSSKERKLQSIEQHLVLLGFAVHDLLSRGLNLKRFHGNSRYAMLCPILAAVKY